MFDWLIWTIIAGAGLAAAWRFWRFAWEAEKQWRPHPTNPRLMRRRLVSGWQSRPMTPEEESEYLSETGW